MVCIFTTIKEKKLVQEHGSLLSASSLLFLQITSELKPILTYVVPKEAQKVEKDILLNSKST